MQPSLQNARVGGHACQSDTLTKRTLEQGKRLEKDGLGRGTLSPFTFLPFIFPSFPFGKRGPFTFENCQFSRYDLFARQNNKTWPNRQGRYAMRVCDGWRGWRRHHVFVFEDIRGCLQWCACYWGHPGDEPGFEGLIELVHIRLVSNL